MATATLSTQIPIAESPIPEAAIPAEPAGKNWLLRLIDAIAVARLRKAEEEIRRHGHLLPDAWEREAYRLGPNGEDQLPFTR